MKKEIEDMILVIKSGRYDNCGVHIKYDELLERFIINYDAELLPLITVLINIEKDFWYE
jgi:hypothetical protein